jgi:AraC family transcriptional regulator
VFDVLSHRPRTQVQRAAWLGDGLQVALWRNEHDRTGYRQPGHHTVSVYVEGGHETRYLGERGAGVGDHGAPGRSCILPAEHESGWAIGQPFRFLHLYLSEQMWADRVVRLLDAEPRAHTLERRVFAQDPALADWARQVLAADWADVTQRLAAQAQSHAMLDGLVLSAARPKQRAAAQRLTGGLSVAARRRVLAHIDAHLADPTGQALSLATLAELAHLSEFHFARMFKVSMGCTAHAWVTLRRVRQAREDLVHSRRPLVDIALACGFASASHLNQLLKRHLGATPLQVRQAGGVRLRPQSDPGSVRPIPGC